MNNDFSNILNLLGNTQNTESKTQSALDLSTLLNFQRIFSSLNSKDPRKNLLTSLKPFMRPSRQKNIDTYINLLSILSAINLFSEKGQ